MRRAVVGAAVATCAAAQSPSCVTELERDCGPEQGKTGQPDLCGLCITQHVSALKAAGCSIVLGTHDDGYAWCHELPPPTPPTPPTPPSQKYSCKSNTCTPSATGISKDACVQACGSAPSPIPPPPAPPTPPAPPPAPGTRCGAATSVSMSVSWSPVAGADIYDLQYVPGSSTWGRPEEYTSQTSATASAAVVDLQPGTEYAFRVRAHRKGTSTWGWGAFAQAFACATAAAPAGQPRRLRRVGALSNASVTVAWDPPAGGAAPGAGLVVTAHCGGDGRGGWGAAPPRTSAAAVTVTAPPGATSATLRGLAPGRVHWVRVGGSDPVPLRTARAGVRYVEMLRVSSHQNEVDFLTDKNTGDVAADAGYLTFASGSAVGGRWISQFKDVAMSEYCVEAADEKWADYVSCDAGQKGVREPSCACRCVCDAHFAHETCVPDPKGNPNPKNGAICLCAAASVTYSKKYLGRELIKLPFGSITCDVPGTSPPRKTDVSLGYWYSTPSGGECAEGAAVGTGGCTWARHPVASVVKGSYLLSHGFTPGKTGDVEKAAAWKNGNATQAIFDAHPSHRCCGC